MSFDLGAGFKFMSPDNDKAVDQTESTFCISIQRWQ